MTIETNTCLSFAKKSLIHDRQCDCAAIGGSKFLSNRSLPLGIDRYGSVIINIVDNTWV